MYNHVDKEYKCPICIGISGGNSEDTLIRDTDIVYKDDYVTAFITSFFIAKNKGHVIIVPNEHFENLYDLPSTLGGKIITCSKEMAKALKSAYSCEGITIQQNNEPAGGQHAFHYHMHVFPRYGDDDFYNSLSTKINTTPEERLPYAKK